MQIKKYIALTLKEASQKMKNELGPDAIVLGTRIIEDDPRFGGKKVFELTAGLDDITPDYRETANGDTPDAGMPENLTARRPDHPGFQQPKPKSFADELAGLTGKIYQKRQEKPAKSPDDQQHEALRELLNTDFGKIRKNRENPAPSGNENLQYELKEVREILLQREIQTRTVDMIMNQLDKYSDFLQPSNIDNYVISTISSMIPVSGFEVQKKNKPKIIALVGPTGVGKTTCIAKLSVISKILHNLNIGLISMDTFRLGAIDQLKIFAEISHIDLRVAYETADLPRLVNEFRKKDMIFIDTAGRSQNNTELLKDTRKFLDPLNVDDIYLVLSTTSTTRNMMDVAEKFKVLNYNGIVFTKLDEAVSFGNILNVAAGFNVPVKYLTNGQVIPDDIIAADSEFIANMIYTGKISK
ncbi:MAG: flagellar biosynthesis protein FlhF [Bacteroidota bacterium]